MLLLVIIAISYIAVGLPDSVLGTAWPAIYGDLNLPISLAGYIAMTVSGCTAVSCLFSAKLINRFGTGIVTAVSCLMTAAALLLMTGAENAFTFVLLSIPLGLGAGTVDAALNSFVALHCTSSQMSYLHCFYGLGVTASPYIISVILSQDNNWRRAYFVVGLVQSLITVFIFSVLPYWRKREESDLKEEEASPKTLSLSQLIRMPSVVFSCIMFFFVCAAEYTAGSWGATFFAEYKGVTPDSAARLAMLYYVGMTLGRFVSGVIGKKVNSYTIIIGSFAIMLFSTFVIALPLNVYVSAFGLFLFGFGMGPTFPNLTFLVPNLFGREVSRSVIGVQLASTYIGIMTMPTLFGVLAEKISGGLFPYMLIILIIIYFSAQILMRKRIKTEKSVE